MTTWGTRARRVGAGAAGLAVVAGVWEGYKALGPDAGVTIGGTVVLPRTTDMAMPHLTDMIARFGEPARGATGDTVGQVVLDASLFTLGLAAMGWLAAVVLGLALAVLMTRSRLAESALLPWVVLSQTVPLIAIAPLVRRWGSQIQIGSFEWTNEYSVAVIAAYLAFFPIAVGALRGLKSPEQTHLDLLRTYGVGWWRTLVTLRLPASVPYLLSSLRLAAAAAVIGAVVAEVSIGLRGGIGRLVVEYAQSASGDPARSWAPIFGAIAVGLVATAFVGLLGLLATPYRRQEVSA